MQTNFFKKTKCQIFQNKNENKITQIHFMLYDVYNIELNGL